MKAIILAGGRSRRLFPITNRKPKCLLPLGGETLIDRLLNILRENNLNEVVLVTGFRAKRLAQYVSDNHPDLTFVFVENKHYATTLPAYGFYLARQYLNDTVLYLNSDIYCDRRIIEEIIMHSNSSVTAIQRNAWDEEEVNVVLDQKKRVVKIGKHIGPHESDGEFMGVTKLSKNFNAYLQEALDDFEKNGDRKKFAVDAIDLAVRKGGELYAHDVSQYTACEIDTVEDYYAARALIL